MNRLFIVDGNWFLHRVFHTTNTNRSLHEAIPYSFISLVCKDAIRVKADYLLVAFDGPKVFRHSIDPNYKSDRAESKAKAAQDAIDEGGEPLQSVYEFLPNVRAMLEKAGINWVQPRQYEADDVLVTMSKHWLNRFPEGRVILGTQDKDIYQALNDKVSMFDSSSKPTPRYIKVADAEKHKGVKISQMIDYQTLLGDATDSIPGFDIMKPGKIKKILAQYGSIKKWSEKGTADDKAWLAKNKVRILTNRKLVTMVPDCIADIAPEFMKVPKLKREDMAKSWYEYQDFLYPKTRGLF